MGQQSNHQATCHLERRYSEVKELVRSRGKAEVSRDEGLLKQLDQEMAELRRRDAKLEQLSNTEDNIQFPQSFQSFYVPLLPSITVNQHVFFEDVKKSVSELKSQVKKICSGSIAKISVKNSCQLTLDPNTAHKMLCLSEGNRKVTWSDNDQLYPDHPDRFTTCPQVLCREGLSGACYWEVEWSRGVYIAVSYKGISRRGNYEWFGGSNQAWCLECGASRGTFYHNGILTAMCVPLSTRVEVYLDHRAGTLSFYSVSDTMTLLHRVQTPFTEPLYPGFFVDRSVKIMTSTQ
ncbi:stonustoxin subunit beta-like [Oncorhynchus kisutch]|uniref:stonustoxin subunit beta-like n=1 Tax=Oncorhynchus kisutch TaxID=8019 RepID=UPI0012DD91A7|nr:stonustoxin subunit beta-like [Oncorhynchus kisutch]